MIDKDTIDNEGNTMKIFKFIKYCWKNLDPGVRFAIYLTGWIIFNIILSIFIKEIVIILFFSPVLIMFLLSWVISFRNYIKEKWVLFGKQHEIEADEIVNRLRGSVNKR